jgi:hypothetical protein
MDKFKKPQNRFITLACYSEQTCQIPCDMIPPGIGTHHSVRNSRLLPLALPVCLSVSLFLFTVHRRTFSCVSCGAIFSHDHFFLILFLPLRRSSLTTNSSLQIAAFFFFHVIHQRNDHRGLQFLRSSSPCSLWCFPPVLADHGNSLL